MAKLEKKSPKISAIANALTIVLADFNAKLSTWKPDDPDTDHGIRIDNITSSYGLTQLIADATHILPNSNSCIDLLFTNMPNMIVNSGVLPSLHSNCHHQLIYAKVNFKILYPPPYQRLVWHYGRANVEAIRRSIEIFDWNAAFSNINVNKQVEIFNSVLINIFKNFVPNEDLTVDEKDLPWMKPSIKSMVLQKNKLFKYYINNGKRLIDYNNLVLASNILKEEINLSRNAYFKRLSDRLCDPKTSPKAYWGVLKSFLSGKKVPIIPPVFDGIKFITDFKVKADLFNSYFANQCSIINNESTLPDTNFDFNCTLSSLTFDENELLKLIQTLDVNKSHGHDGISARMIKLCDSSIIPPLMIIYRNCLKEGCFPSNWKKANVTPIYKKGDKSILSNYRPISVLPICAKLFEKIIYKSLYKYFEDNNIFDINQSGFRSGDSCTNQLISITHEIIKHFDSNQPIETRGVFLDMSKAFDKVWHEGLIFKLQNYGIEGKLFSLIKSFLSGRYQRVILNGQTSNWKIVSAGVPQGSILGPLLFLIYINDISVGLKSTVKLFADDTSVKVESRINRRMNN